MTKYVTFPWEQLGQMLRSLSLSGSAGSPARLPSEKLIVG